MRLFHRLFASSLLVVAACAGRQNPNEAPTPTAPVRPLGALVAQQVIVAPTHSLSEVDPFGWTQRIPRSREYLRSVDDAIDAELAARGLGTQWIYPPALVRASKASPSYAVDPYALGAGALKSPKVVVGARLGDPLASQLRTMVALQESARAVLLPVELHFERDEVLRDQGVAVLKVALIDGRLGEVRWIGDVRSDPSPTFSPALVASLANKFADLITAR
ncbi:MAG: hypothetical protein ACJ8AD_10730 [Gemmatimonadaceae bacterium]